MIRSIAVLRDFEHAHRLREERHERHPLSEPADRKELVDEYFIENRTRLLEIAAFLDRLDRADPSYAGRDFRMQAFAEALAGLGHKAGRVDHIQHAPERSERGPARRARPQERARRLRPLERGAPLMKYIDHHAHMVSRTTDDYQQMALTGCVAVTEPAFWAGWDRSHADGFEDYFRQLTDFEPKRAAQYRIQHYTWMAMNPKEADDRELSREVLKRIPKFLDRPTVLGIGEIGLNRVTRNEIETYTEQIELALAHKQLILIHTPHLEDKLKGTKISVDVLRSFPTLEPGRVLVDHAEEHTLEMILDHGYWAGLTLYPQTKVSAQRAADIIERFGPDRILRRRRVRLGPERFDGRAAVHHGDAAPQAPRGADSARGVREPGAVPEPVGALPDPAGAEATRRAQTLVGATMTRA